MINWHDREQSEDRADCGAEDQARLTKVRQSERRYENIARMRAVGNQSQWWTKGELFHVGRL